MGWNQSGLFQIVIITGSGGKSGLFVYSPKPALGNLVASIAALGGKDAYGNAYVPGVVSYFNGAQTIAMELSAGEVIWGIAPGPGGPYALNGPVLSVDSTGTILNIAAGSGGHINTILGIFNALAGAAVTGGLTSDTANITAGLTWAGGATGDTALIQAAKAGGLLFRVINTQAGATAAMTALQVAAAGDAFVRMRVAGDGNNRIGFDWNVNNFPRMHFGPGNAAVDTTIYRAAANLFGSDYIAFDNGGTAEGFQTVTFANGWTNGVGIAAGYRRVAAPDHCVQWVGDYVTPAGLAANQAVLTAVPAAYRPITVQPILGVDVVTGGLVRFTMTAGGVLTYQSGSVAGHDVQIPAGSLVQLLQ
jgi:hypothetical protein